MLIPNIDILNERDRISVNEYNNRGRVIQTLTRSSGTLALSNSSGLHIRRPVINVEVETILATIIQGLQYENLETGDSEINYYEIEFINNPIQNYTSNKTYSKYTKVKYQDKIYISTRDVPINTFPTNPSYWSLSSATKAGIWGYSEDLIESGIWFEKDLLVEVIRYEFSSPPIPNCIWWIKETTFRSWDGNDCSILYNPTKKKVEAVFT